MSTRLKVYLFLGLLAVIAIGGYLAVRRFADGAVAQANIIGPQTKADDGDQPIPVELAAAVEGPISAFVSSTANLKALRDVELLGRAEGVVSAVSAEEGDLVEKGAVLAQLDDRAATIRLEMTRQKLEQARLQHEKARIRQEKAATQIANTQAEIDRNEKAFAEGLISQKEVDDLRYKLSELEHDQRVSASEQKEFGHRVEELEAELSQVRYDLAQTEVTAPFSGYITERKIELGQTVRNLDSLFRLGAFSPLQAEVHLSERDARRVRPGQQATVMLGSGNETAEATVRRVSPIVDDSTGTVKVTVELHPPSRLFKPGAFVRVGIETDARANAILVPKRALLQQDGEIYLFVSSGDQALRREVTLGYESGGAVEILEGVSPGEKVVVAGQGSLKEGSAIREVEPGTSQEPLAESGLQPAN